MNAYPFIIEHNHTEVQHLVTGEEKHTGNQRTFCGWLRKELDCHEVSITILNSVRNKKLCKICLMADEVYGIISDEISKPKLNSYA